VTQLHQMTIDEVCRARATDPETSKAAATSARHLANEHRRAILAAMRTGGDWTATEVGERCGLSAVQVCRRLAELRNDGLIRETVNTRPTASGRASQCYEAVTKTEETMQ
jgi:predicted ArsR family transcriptional regulator